MAIENIGGQLYRLEPGPFDVHAHPRIFDAISDDDFVAVNEGQEGKAGLEAYTRTAFESGITGILAMPNESVRIYDLSSHEYTVTKPYPVSNLDRVRAAQSHIEQQAFIPTGIHMTVDPETAFTDKDKQTLNHERLYRNFRECSDEVTSLKLYGDETTGGYNVDIQHIPEIARVWHEVNPEKPIVLHLENENVAKVLTAINVRRGGKEVPLHIAHVSSQQELEAVLWAKEVGMNVSCEVTVHHLFLDETVRDEIGAYGCMKPTLKTREDIYFLWAHIADIDIIASDCAPHRRSDKEAAKPAFGVTTHTVMLPLLFGAVADGKLTYEQLDDKLCTQPRARFNLPLNDGSFIEYHAGIDENLARRTLMPERYGYNPFKMLSKPFRYMGSVVNSRAGVSYGTEELNPSYSHLIRPANLRTGEARD